MITHTLVHRSKSIIRFSAPTAAIILVAFGSIPAGAQVVGTGGETITVNTTADGFVIRRPGEPEPCTLRDAVLAANTNQPVGGCLGGKEPKRTATSPLTVDGLDRIEFALGAGTPVIQLRRALPVITEAVTIDGAANKSTRVVIDGGTIPTYIGAPVHGLVVTGLYTSIRNLVINRFSGNGILLTGLTQDGRPLPPREPPEINDEPPELIDPIMDPCGPAAKPSDPTQCPPPGGGGDGVDLPQLLRGTFTYHYIGGTYVGTDASGTVPLGNGQGGRDQAGIAVLTGGNRIGGPDPEERNVISGNSGHGLLISGMANIVENNAVGADASGRIDVRNLYDGVRVDGGQFHSASCEVRDNVIAFNNENGFSGGYNLCKVLSNSIRGHGALGIDVGISGVTANHPTGSRHRIPNTPMLTDVRTIVQHGPLGITLRTRVTGELIHFPNLPVEVQVFNSDACSTSGHGEGRWMWGSTITSGSGTRTFTVEGPAILWGRVFTATATTGGANSLGMTSEFSPCYVN